MGLSIELVGSAESATFAAGPIASSSWTTVSAPSNVLIFAILALRPALASRGSEQELFPQTRGPAQARLHCKWHLDETYIKVRGQWMYLYRAVDSVGDTVEFFFSERRERADRKTLPQKGIGAPWQTGSHRQAQAAFRIVGNNRLVIGLAAVDAVMQMRPASKLPGRQECPARGAETFSLAALRASGWPKNSDPVASAIKIGVRNPTNHGASIRFWARAISARTRLPR
jgi:hypothetical protein